MHTTNSRHSRSDSRTPRGSGTHSDRSRSFRSGSGSRPGQGSSFKRGGQGRGGNRGGGGGRKMPSFDPSRFINTNPVELKEEVYTPKHTFGTFGLEAKLAKNIEALGLTIPTPIQDQIIPEILAGKDVIGLAETGTGKTAAFLVPLIHKTLENKNRQTLILAPTRELAIQIEQDFKKLARGFSIFSVILVGGMPVYPQVKMLRHKNQFIIGTPGRVMDLINRGAFNPNTISTVILDEADRMLDMGFINDMKSIISQTPKSRETLFFSATMSAGTTKLVHEFLKSPVTISVKKKDVTNSISQDVVAYDNHSKFETLTTLLKDPEHSRVMIFGAMKHGVEKLARELSDSNIKSESLHGNKNHTQRQRALQRFKQGDARVLVATDVAARGIHIDDVSHVINYDLPNTFEDYVHRIGRTGRGDKRGKALTFIQNQNKRRY